MPGTATTPRFGVVPSEPNRPSLPTVSGLDNVPTDLTTVARFAEELPDVGERWIRRCVDEHRVPVYRLGGRVLFSRADFLAYIASGRIEAEV